MTDGGISTCGGNVTLNHTGNVTAIANTGGGAFSSSGQTFTAFQFGVHTGGGNVILNHSGLVNFQDGGVQTGGGNFYSEGNGGITITDAGLSSGNGTIDIAHLGNAVLQGIGIQSNANVSLAANSLQLEAPINAGSGQVSLQTPNGTAPWYQDTDVSGAALNFSNGNPLQIRINGTAANTGYDALTVNGQANLNGATLQLSGSHTPAIGESFTIVNNVSGAATTGAFTDLPEGAQIIGLLGSFLNASITYAGGNGNDVVLTVLAPCDPIVCPAAQTLVLGPNCSAPLPDYTSLVETDESCTVQSVTQSPLPGTTVSGAGNVQLEITVTYIYGNSESCTFTVTKVDQTPPTITCPPTQTLALGAGCTANLPDYRNLATNVDDNCGVADFSQTPAPGTPVYEPGNMSVTLVVTDVNGSSANCSFTVTKVDNLPPTALCQPAFSINLNASGNAWVTVGQVNNGSSDNCGIQNMSVSPSAFTCAHVGANTVTLTVTDMSANSSTCATTVTVVDNILPTALCKNATVYLDADGNATVAAAQVNNGSYDNCGIQHLSVSPSAFTCANTGANPVTLTVTDVNGNSASCQATVTVLDNILPSISCPGPILVSTDQTSCQATGISLDSPVYNDNCSVGMTLTWALTQGMTLISSGSGILGQISQLPAGSYHFTYTVKDASNNPASCNFGITVYDGINPTALCQNATASLNAAGSAMITATQINNGSYDNCAIQNMSVSPNTFGCESVGNQSVTLTVTDTNGNSAACTATVAVVDNLLPTALCQNVTVNLNTSGAASVTASQVNNGSSDNCGLSGISVSPSEFACANVGSNTVTLTATDNNGNSSTCTATVTVNPVATTSAITVSPASQQYSDRVTFTATITGGAACNPQWQAAELATFFVSGQEIGVADFEVIGDNLVATLVDECLLESLSGQMSPGNKPVTAVFSGIDNTHFTVVQPAPASLQIEKEDALVAYNGLEYFSTPSPSNCTGTITLMAYVEDVNDTPAGCRGDIRNADITFSHGGIPGTTLGAANLPVGLVDPNNQQEGIAVNVFTHTLQGNSCNSGGETFEVFVKAGGYYAGETDEDEMTLVTLALPGNDFVSGGGHLVVSSSAGTYAGTAGSKMNFGFNMKWNPSGKNLQGKMNIIFRRLVNGEWRTYQIKSNSINSMSVNNSDPDYRKAIISTKATLHDITNQNSPVSLGGNLNLAVQAWEHKTQNNGSLDKIAVTLTGNGNQGLLFSSHWVSGATVEQIINGGKIMVRNGENQSLVQPPFSIQQFAEEPASALNVYNQPNPFYAQTDIMVETGEEQHASLRVFDSMGRLVATLHDGMLTNGLHRFTFHADHLPGGFYFYTLAAGGEVKTGKMLHVK
jgi:hypothetical protein